MKKIVLLIMLFLCCNTTAILAQHVYKTPSGKKYHLATCRMVENVSKKISLDKATESGLGPCKICKPPVGAMAIPDCDKEGKGTDKTIQCKGTTKAGSRCKHMTRIANSYCFQHSPK